MSLLNVTLAVIFIFLLHTQLGKASRVFPGEVLMNKELQLQSLQKGDVPPIGGSGCTFIPGTSGPSCPVKEMNVAGNALSGSGAYPRLMVPFGVATNS